MENNVYISVLKSLWNFGEEQWSLIVIAIWLSRYRWWSRYTVHERLCQITENHGFLP